MRQTTQDDIEVIEWLSKIRWPLGPVCYGCQKRNTSRLIEARGIYQCKCRKQFSVFSGTDFEGTRLTPFQVANGMLYFYSESCLYPAPKKFTTVRSLKKWVGISYSAAHSMHVKLSKHLDKNMTETKFVAKVLK